ncbi:hypothetical protein M5K25_006733 [Dendrobium thyrsiflorum]|uniref:Aminotransferase-like plant mobile domain-containing protein n=1 Tax=Dendrobium thyrsiflorum TaxID=117978 RepID=A0ABD0VJM2_DENTH
MASEQRQIRKRMPTGETSGDAAAATAPPVQLHLSIASLHGIHWAAHPDGGTILEAALHLLMVHEWPVNCPRFMEALRMVGLDCIWAWEHLHVGRPSLRVPFPVELDGMSVGFRWNEKRLRNLPMGNLTSYMDELDGLLDSQVIWEPYTPKIRAQVAKICLTGEEVWTARVPLISWKRVEWHLPDRVLRKFGLCLSTDVEPMDPSFKRVDGRGKPDMDWMMYHQAYITIWESRHGYVVSGEQLSEDTQYLVHQYLHWYKSWPYYICLRHQLSLPQWPILEHQQSAFWYRDFFLSTEAILQEDFNGTEETRQQRNINTVAELCRTLRSQIYIQEQGYFDGTSGHETPFSMTQDAPQYYSGFAGPSSYPDQGPSQNFSYPVSADLQAYLTPDVVPTTLPSEGMPEPEVNVEQHHMLCERPLRPPQHYTPGSDALPQRPLLSVEEMSRITIRHIIPIIRQQLDKKPKEIIARMESKFEIKISYMKAWNAHRKAIEPTFGSYDESYHSLFHFMEALSLSQPGTIYNVQLAGAARFKGLFWAFGPSTHGWQHCRLILSLDGTVLLGKYRGTLLAAVGIDGNSELYPLTFTVVESESNESWFWFLQNLYELVNQVAE